MAYCIHTMPPLPPGELVIEYLAYHRWTQADLARLTGLTLQEISDICEGIAPVTSSAASAFEKAFQRPAHLWMNLQSQYDEATAPTRET